MRFERSFNKDCPHCAGTSYVWEDVVIDGGLSVSMSECSCVQYSMDDEMKANIASAVELANAARAEKPSEMDKLLSDTREIPGPWGRP